MFCVPKIDGTVIDIDLVEETRDREALIEDYWYVHPRYVFLKTLMQHAHLVDVGAGSGGLIQWRSWGAPDRSDLNMYAVDRVEGEHFNRYIDFDIIDLCEDQVKYPEDAFDAAICSHVIDHVADSLAVIAELARIVKPGAKVYLEWLNADTQPVVTREGLAAYGIETGTIHFTDDANHKHALKSELVATALIHAGFNSVHGGVICNDFLFPELLRFGVANQDRELTTLGLWLALGTVRYLVLEKR